jgi:hypothetical protein
VVASYPQKRNWVVLHDYVIAVIVSLILNILQVAFLAFSPDSD